MLDLSYNRDPADAGTAFISDSLSPIGGCYTIKYCACSDFRQEPIFLP